MNSHPQPGGKEKEEKTTWIITFSPSSPSQEQNTGSVTEKKVNVQDHTSENQNQTEQIWRTIHWQCACIKCKPDRKGEEDEKSKQNPTEKSKVQEMSSTHSAKGQSDNEVNGQPNLQIDKTNKAANPPPRRDSSPRKKKGLAKKRNAKENGTQDYQPAETELSEQASSIDTASPAAKEKPGMELFQVNMREKSHSAEGRNGNEVNEQPNSHVDKTNPPARSQVSRDNSPLWTCKFVRPPKKTGVGNKRNAKENGIHSQTEATEQQESSTDTASPAAKEKPGMELFLVRATAQQKQENDNGQNKIVSEPNSECQMETHTPPTLILYLLGDDKTFCSENNRKKEELGRHFMNCVLDTPTWVFANSELEGCLKDLRWKCSFKENQSFFFLHTKDMKYNVFSALKYISEKTKASLVFLFLNGDKDTFLATVPLALEEKIPVVAIKGSGNFVDDLPPKKRSRESKDTIEKSTDDNQHRHKETIPKRQTSQSSEEPKATTEKSKEDNGETTQSTQVEKSVADTNFKEYDLISNFGRKSALRLSLLDVIFTEDDDQKSDDKKNGKTDTNGRKEHELTRLTLAHAWGCFEKAREMRWSKFESSTLYYMMEKALLHEQVEFVELFLELGVDLKDFLNKNLSSLWCKEYEKKDSMLKKLYKEKELTGTEENKGFNLPEETEKAHKHLKLALKDLMDDIGIKNDERKKTEESIKDPVVLLFLWALLTKKFNLAKFVWRDVQDHVTTALVACILLRAMRSRTMNDVRFDDEQQEITTTIELFEGLAIKTLNNCYKEDQAKTFQLLSRIQETEYWNCVTCLEIAELARCKKFIAQEPCQNFADRIWRGLDPYSKNEEDKIDQFLIITRFFYAISAIFVIVPKLVMDFSQNKRGPSQLRYALARFCFYWPRYWEDPSFKFYSGWFFFMGFLLLYAYVLMARIPPPDVHISEVALLIWFMTMHFEELRVAMEWVQPKRQRVKVFILSQLGILNVTNFYLAWGGILQWLLFDSSAFSLHVVLCINFISFICRLFYFSSINSQLGPKVFMIYQMIKEMILFSVLLIIIFLGYGVIMYSIDNRGQGVVNSTVVLSLPVEPFWLMLADRPGDTGESEDDPKVVFRGLLRVAYLFFTSLLLINVLIAAFGNLYESINNQKEDLRKYQKFHMIVKFYLGSPLPPPLTLFYYPILYICRCSGHDITKNKDHFGKGHGGNKTCKENRFRQYLSSNETIALLNWAKLTTETYTEEKPKTVEDLVKETMENNFPDEEKKTVTKEYCENCQTSRNSSDNEYDELTEDLLTLHDSILDSTSTLNKAMAVVEERIACHPCIIYRSCVLCGKPPGNPTHSSGRHRIVGIQAENSLRRKSMPNLRKLPPPEC
ncbi:transient receptor potential cation channel subfamily M member 8-like isoform X3 [Pomacea canaliculata]|uniref:transient receptor potential cation channel subfamily M member 8-like isoform X3 n=1 Tax=Pomacea canaliculata TaxID=400727 RepID=UPI000D7290FD|nr:transient receptor potential cation channel subfamily M member 8-like isoform X3 [Pomacea canaliculata]